MCYYARRCYVLVVGCCLEDAGLTFVELEVVGLAIVSCTIDRGKMVAGSAPVDSSIDLGTVDLSGGSANVNSPDDWQFLIMLLIWLFLYLSFL